MPAKIPKMMPTILKFSLIASAFSFATAAPVTRLGALGDHRGQPVGELGLATRRRSALTSIASNCPGAPSTSCAVVGVEVRRRGAAEVLDPVAVADRADDGELPGRALEQDLDRGAERDVVVLGAGGVDGDLVPVGRGVAGEQLHVAAELLVGRHAVAVGRGATVGGDGPARRCR